MPTRLINLGKGIGVYGVAMHFTHDIEKVLKFKSESVGHRIFDDIIAFTVYNSYIHPVL